MKDDAKKSPKLKRIDGGLYTIENYTPPEDITPAQLRQITKDLLEKVEPPAEASQDEGL